jgi:cytochrome b
MIRHDETRVWDPLVRVFHWTLVAAFVVAYFTEDDAMTVHVVAGYTVTGLILFRLLWGFVGPSHARFSDFVFRPRTVVAYLKDMARGGAQRYLGHNPAGGVMVLALLVALALTAATGLITYGAHEHAGPFAAWMAGSTKSQTHQWKEVHEFFANLTVVLVLFHIAGVVLSSLTHHENLPLAMVTGRKRI